MMSTGSKKVLIAPLDWGLGHATRMVPIINHYLSTGWNVFLAGDGASGEWLKKRYPNLTFLKLPGYQMQYSKKIPFVLQMIRSLPRIALSISRERRRIKALQRQFRFDLILSDNRYGVRVKDVKSYIFSHQINIRFAFARKQIFKIQKAFFRRFDGVLVPDFPTYPNLAGDLSALKKGQDVEVPLYYLGALSRFSQVHYVHGKPRYKYAAVISGPEPHKSLFVAQVIGAFSQIDDRTLVIVNGVVKPATLPDQIDYIISPSDDDFLKMIQSAEVLISRSGYTTLMDLLYLDLPAVLVPTPGQTEQEYLARYWSDQGWAQMIDQQDFELKKINAPSRKLPFGHSSLAVHLERIF